MPRKSASRLLATANPVEARRLVHIDAASGPPPRLLNLRQAAVYLGVHVNTMRDYVILGYVPKVSLPPRRVLEGDRQRETLRRVSIDIEDLDAFIASRKMTDTRDVQSVQAPNSPKKTAECAQPVPFRRPACDR